jgi:hypothetical protein
LNQPFNFKGSKPSGKSRGKYSVDLSKDIPDLDPYFRLGATEKNLELFHGKNKIGV